MTKNTLKGLKGKAVRVLRDLHVDGQRYLAGQVVAFPPKQADTLEKDGSVDTHQDAVGYALGQGVEAVQHAAPATEEPASTPEPTPAPTPEPTPAPDGGAAGNDPAQ